MNALDGKSKSNRVSSVRRSPQSGFCLAELLVAALILVVVSLAALHMLDSVQRATACQAEIQVVMDNTRAALDLVSRVLRQAGNDPTDAGFDGLTIVDNSHIRVLSDLTGSLGPANPDKGDPDGDTSDSGEDITIRYNAPARTVELIPAGGSAQTIASNVAAFSMEYLDGSGNFTTTGSAVRSVVVSIIGESSFPDPQTGHLFRLPVTGIVRLATRG
jgi:Tfp pilus assembly protein PilX